MKVLIIGAGAVGLALAASLYDSGVQVDLVARGETARSIREGGIIRCGIFRGVTVPAGAVRVFGSVPGAGSGYDYILVSSKTTGNTEIASGLQARRADILTPGGFVVLFQNGYGNERVFAGAVDAEKILHASFAIGFQRPRRNVSEVTVITKPALIGRLSGGAPEEAKPLTDAVTQGGIPCSLTDEIAKTMWAKLLYNCALNPISALLGTDYGGLVQCESSVALLGRVIDEIFSVMQAAGHSTFWKDAEAYKKDFFKNILPPTYRHHSSTLQDMERKIPTEIDSLNGAVVRLGNEYGVPTPCNETIVRMVKAAESIYHYGENDAQAPAK